MEDHRTLLTPVKGWKIRIQKHKQMLIQKHGNKRQMKHHNDNYITGKSSKTISVFQFASHLTREKHKWNGKPVMFKNLNIIFPNIV